MLLRNDARADDIWIVDAYGERNLTLTPRVRDGWPTWGPDGLVYDEEDARPFVAADGKRVIFNRRHPGYIDIVERLL